MNDPLQIFVETYGCQMNLADTEVVLGILTKAGYTQTDDLARADVVLVNTCAVRDHAEQRVYGRLGDFRHYKRENPGLVVGVLGCMAERLRRDLLESESHIDLVVGPDEYRRIPELIENAVAGEKGIAVRLSRVENYDDIIPLRTDGITAWISVMRGCDKFCTFCVVPFTRGRERSRTLESVVREVENLSARGFKEVTLLGQNVNSYHDGKHDFADLLADVARVDRSMRVRFTTSHPQDMSEKLIRMIAGHENICNHIHLPIQSGSDRILRLMNRMYTCTEYLRLVSRIRSFIPSVSLSTDIIAGFPTETAEDHQRTLDVLREVEYDGAFTFRYSPRENTKAWHLGDDVSEEVKIDRLNEIIEAQRGVSYRRNQRLIGQTVEVLVEGESRKSTSDLSGRTDTNKTVVFPRGDAQIGHYLNITIERANSATLFGRPVLQARQGYGHSKLAANG
ncbi:MAG: tRNA (N6-isopentenyl adenosine(37)-C2)-methylthiotransferase MiaB [Ignavibacteria bacterium]|nr:tRNA (N6-isopentenyl adenosine(37)-C2)-methylthiotransferase MiaB [Ignavibacteria bacterium]